MSSMKRYKVRASAVVAAAVLLLSAMVVSVSAYEPCRTAVTRVVTKVEYPHYSKATVARWLQWGKAHPNYHAPARQPVVTKQEVEDMFEFACALPALESDQVEDFLTEIPDEPIAFGVDAPRPFPVDLTTPPPSVALLNVPVQPMTADDVEAPEPQSWILGATGMCFVGFCLWKRKQRGDLADALDLSPLFSA